MKTKVYILDNTMATTNTLEEIKNRIPCWVNVEVAEDGYELVAEIQCREADVAFVERMLADVV